MVSRCAVWRTEGAERWKNNPRESRSRDQLARRVLQFAIDPQLDTAHGQQEKPCLGLSRPDQVADPKLPLPEPRGFRPGQRIFHAFVIHGNLPLPSAITGVELRSSGVPWADKYLRRAPGAAEVLSLQAFQPRGRVRIPAPAPAHTAAEKHCAAQAEYGRLAAQA